MEKRTRREYTKEFKQQMVALHATSKIKKVDDLHTMDTLGFRGEALPTIAAVSRFTLMTREPESELGSFIDIRGGKTEEIREAGCSIGTTIKVEDLFFNTPARKKFMKTTVTEGSKINDFVIKLALANPDIAFKFINNNKLVLTSPGNGSVYDCLQSIYGSKVSEELLGVEFIDEDIEIRGFLTKPSMCCWQWAFPLSWREARCGSVSGGKIPRRRLIIWRIRSLR